MSFTHKAHHPHLSGSVCQHRTEGEPWRAGRPHAGPHRESVVGSLLKSFRKPLVNKLKPGADDEPAGACLSSSEGPHGQTSQPTCAAYWAHVAPPLRTSTRPHLPRYACPFYRSTVAQSSARAGCWTQLPSCPGHRCSNVHVQPDDHDRCLRCSGARCDASRWPELSMTTSPRRAYRRLTLRRCLHTTQPCAVCRAQLQSMRATQDSMV